MASLLKISDATVLGLHAMVYLAEQMEETVTTCEIAAFLCASEAHLAKVLQRLVRAGLIKSVRGPKGGFSLVKGGEATTLLAIYEVLEGTFPKCYCLFESPICDRTGCILGGLLAKLGKEVKDYLTATTVAELAARRNSVID